MTVTHDAHVSPSPFCTLVKYRHRKLEASNLSSILWMLEDLKTSEKDHLDVLSYGEPLREAIL